MILMSVGDDNTPDLIPVFLKIGEIGNNKIDTEHIRLGESKTAVYNYNIIFKFIYRDILADLVQAAEKSDLNGFDVFLPVLFRVRRASFLLVGLFLSRSFSFCVLSASCVRFFR